jgi:predicted kinase
MSAEQKEKKGTMNPAMPEKVYHRLLSLAEEPTLRIIS